MRRHLELSAGNSDNSVSLLRVDRMIQFFDNTIPVELLTGERL